MIVQMLDSNHLPGMKTKFPHSAHI